MLDKLMGKASISSTSAYDVERLFCDDEILINVFKFMRDEIVITTRGIYNIDAQGLTGKRIEYKFFLVKALHYISMETAGIFDRDFDIKIGLNGNTVVTEHTSYSAPISIKVHKNETEAGFELYKTIKAML
ncbi:hypothetical protein AZF37_08720 [endosymbiont 'TC1' of Trimyema compressum]|uniref:PH domain-containing protein n=1 Tax=endosymbiont 'TC1' of Trimyema compressum TaxID=243899 RepID=UPI0007F0D8EA|nr:PH domain-containing protein [endosymbiont 'TC1' of Trimyema compressum]AMP21221.1 hypothetical protein AZF37_08720 [endosymbiont 'TC1' of Trimyema compressum]